MVNGFHNNEQALMMVSTLELNFPQQFINTTNRLEYHDPQRRLMAAGIGFRDTVVCR
jgi:hypothetical protein